MATTDPNVNAALDEVARKLGISREEALKLTVSKGLQELTARAMTDQQVFQSNASQRQIMGHELTHVIQQQHNIIRNMK